MPDGEYEIRNRHGDVVQRGEMEVTDVHETPGARIIEVEFQDPAEFRKHGDYLMGHLRTNV